MKKLTLIGTCLTGIAAVVGAINLLADNFAGKKSTECASAPVEEAPKEAEETKPETPIEEAPAEAE